MDKEYNEGLKFFQIFLMIILIGVVIVLPWLIGAGLNYDSNTVSIFTNWGIGFIIILCIIAITLIVGFIVVGLYNLAGWIINKLFKEKQ